MSTEERRLLESWKEISAYLKRSERTCRRFEETLDLPVHRLDGTPRAHVFAYADELDEWLRRKLNHARDEAVQEEKRRGRKRIVRFAIVPGAGALAVAAAFLWLSFRPAPGPILPHNPSLAVLPFDNPAKDTGLEPWRTALADLVITDLVQSRYVNVVRITDLARKLVELKLGDADSFSDEALKTVAEKTGADYIAWGSLGRENGTAVVSINVRNPRTDEQERSFRAGFGGENEVFSAADEITRKIKLAVDLTRRHVSRDIDRDVARISTSSPQAFRLYSQGHRLAGIGRHAESISILQRAVEIDPEFALAYTYLFRACGIVNRQEDEKAYIRKAVDLSGRLSERERGELEVLFYRNHENDEVRGLRALERLNRTYPEDRIGSVVLLGYYVDHEEWDRALQVAERAWPANTAEFSLCGQLALCFWNRGQPERAEAVLNEFIGANPGHTYWRNAVRLRSQVLTRLGKFDEALGELDRLNAKYPNDQGMSTSRAIALLYKPDFAGAETEFRKGLAEKEPSLRIQALMFLRDLSLLRGRVDEAAEQIRLALEIADGAPADDPRMAMDRTALHLDMAHLHRLAGHPAEALGEVEAALLWRQRSSQGPSPSLHILHVKALLLADLDRWEAFYKLAEEIKGIIEERRMPKLMRISHHLSGYAELKKGRYEKAVAHFSRAVDLAPPAGNAQFAGADPEYLYSLAQALDLLDRGFLNPAAREREFSSRHAFSVYEKVIQPSVNRLHAGDIYARSLYEVARYYDVDSRHYSHTAEEVKAMNAKAVQGYREFLALWGGADPLFAPLVEEAGKRLAAIERQ